MESFQKSYTKYPLCTRRCFRFGVQNWTKETEITAFMELKFLGVEDNNQRVKMDQLWNLLNNLNRIMGVYIKICILGQNNIHL